jgi:molybdopterin synthase sulfur carrier subunit
VNVLIPGPLLSYTRSKQVQARGASLAELLGDLDRQYPGLSFRVIDEQRQMRPHMRFFVNGEQILDLNHPLAQNDEVQIVQALSGG